METRRHNASSPSSHTRAAAAQQQQQGESTAPSQLPQRQSRRSLDPPRKRRGSVPKKSKAAAHKNSARRSSNNSNSPSKSSRHHHQQSKRKPSSSGGGRTNKSNDPLAIEENTMDSGSRSGENDNDDGNTSDIQSDDENTTTNERPQRLTNPLTSAHTCRTANDLFRLVDGVYFPQPDTHSLRYAANVLGLCIDVEGLHRSQQRQQQQRVTTSRSDTTTATATTTSMTSTPLTSKNQESTDAMEGFIRTEHTEDALDPTTHQSTKDATGKAVDNETTVQSTDPTAEAMASKDTSIPLTTDAILAHVSRRVDPDDAVWAVPKARRLPDHLLMWNPTIPSPTSAAATTKNKNDKTIPPVFDPLYTQLLHSSATVPDASLRVPATPGQHAKLLGRPDAVVTAIATVTTSATTAVAVTAAPVDPSATTAAATSATIPTTATTITTPATTTVPTIEGTTTQPTIEVEPFVATTTLTTTTDGMAKTPPTTEDAPVGETTPIVAPIEMDPLWHERVVHSTVQEAQTAMATATAVALSPLSDTSVAALTLPNSMTFLALERAKRLYPDAVTAALPASPNDGPWSGWVALQPKAIGVEHDKAKDSTESLVEAYPPASKEDDTVNATPEMVVQAAMLYQFEWYRASVDVPVASSELIVRVVAHDCSIQKPSDCADSELSHQPSPPLVLLWLHALILEQARVCHVWYVQFPDSSLARSYFDAKGGGVMHRGRGNEVVCDVHECNARSAFLKYHYNHCVNHGDGIGSHCTGPMCSERKIVKCPVPSKSDPPDRRCLVRLPTMEEAKAVFSLPEIEVDTWGEMQPFKRSNSVTIGDGTFGGNAAIENQMSFTSATSETKRNTLVRIRAILPDKEDDSMRLVRLDDGGSEKNEIVAPKTYQDPGSLDIIRHFELQKSAPASDEDSELLRVLVSKQAELKDAESALGPTLHSLFACIVEERMASESEEFEKRREEDLQVLQESKRMLLRRKEMDVAWQKQLEIDMDAVCEICADGEVTPDNQILFCESCNVAVHQVCYGIERIPEGDYYCTACRYLGRHLVSSTDDLASDALSSAPQPLPICCELCPIRQGAFARSAKPAATATSEATDHDRWVHVVCAKWHGLHHVDPDDPTLVEDVTEFKAQFRRHEIRCELCFGERGAMLKCRGNADCNLWFHVTCARAVGTMNVTHGENCKGPVEENPWSLACATHSENMTKYKPKKVWTVEQLVEAAQNVPPEPKPPVPRKPFNTLNRRERTELLADPTYENPLMFELLNKKFYGTRCEVCDLIEDESKNLTRCYGCNVVFCASCKLESDTRRDKYKCPACSFSEPKEKAGEEYVKPQCTCCFQPGGLLRPAKAIPVNRKSYWKSHPQEFKRSLFAKQLWVHSLCAFWLPKLSLPIETGIVDLSNVVLSDGKGLISYRPQCILCGMNGGLKIHCDQDGCCMPFGKEPTAMHVTCARAAGLEVRSNEEDDDIFLYAKCYRHGGVEFNFRAQLEDLIEIEKRRAGKTLAKSDGPYNFSEGSRIMNSAVHVMRILGWAWRWAEWWVDYDSSWEPFLEPGENEKKMTKEQLKIIDSTRESRCEDARKCRLEAFGAALRNRSYDLPDGGFRGEALDRALRAVLHTQSLVGPLESNEIDFFAEWLCRAYRSKSRRLAFGVDKHTVSDQSEFCVHMKDKSPKFELGNRSLPGTQMLQADGVFEFAQDEVDDFLQRPILQIAAKKSRREKQRHNLPSKIVTISKPKKRARRTSNETDHSSADGPTTTPSKRKYSRSQKSQPKSNDRESFSTDFRAPYNARRALPLSKTRQTSDASRKSKKRIRSNDENKSMSKIKQEPSEACLVRPEEGRTDMNTKECRSCVEGRRYRGAHEITCVRSLYYQPFDEAKANNLAKGEDTVELRQHVLGSQSATPARRLLETHARKIEMNAEAETSLIGNTKMNPTVSNQSKSGSSMKSGEAIQKKDNQYEANIASGGTIDSVVPEVRNSAAHEAIDSSTAVHFGNEAKQDLRTIDIDEKRRRRIISHPLDDETTRSIGATDNVDTETKTRPKRKNTEKYYCESPIYSSDDDSHENEPMKRRRAERAGKPRTSKSNDHDDVQVSPPPSRRGYMRKIETESEVETEMRETALKKRGRPPKNAQNQPKPPPTTKKRPGRPPKKLGRPKKATNDIFFESIDHSKAGVSQGKASAHTEEADTESKDQRVFPGFLSSHASAVTSTSKQDGIVKRRGRPPKAKNQKNSADADLVDKVVKSPTTATAKDTKSSSSSCDVRKMSSDTGDEAVFDLEKPTRSLRGTVKKSLSNITEDAKIERSPRKVDALPGISHEHAILTVELGSTGTHERSPVTFNTSGAGAATSAAKHANPPKRRGRPPKTKPEKSTTDIAVALNNIAGKLPTGSPLGDSASTTLPFGRDDVTSSIAGDSKATGEEQQEAPKKKRGRPRKVASGILSVTTAGVSLQGSPQVSQEGATVAEETSEGKTNDPNTETFSTFTATATTSATLQNNLKKRRGRPPKGKGKKSAGSADFNEPASSPQDAPSSTPATSHNDDSIKTEVEVSGEAALGPETPRTDI